MEIRNAINEDFATIHQFVTELENQEFNYEKQKNIFTKNIANTDNIYLVAHENNKPIGYLSCHIQNLLHHGGPIAEIQEMFVVAEKRNAGIGKMLIDRLIQLAKQKGVLQIEVTSNNDRHQTHKFYERENFRFTHKKFVRSL